MKLELLEARDNMTKRDYFTNLNHSLAVIKWCGYAYHAKIGKNPFIKTDVAAKLYKMMEHGTYEFTYLTMSDDTPADLSALTLLGIIRVQPQQNENQRLSRSINYALTAKGKAYLNYAFGTHIITNAYPQHEVHANQQTDRLYHEPQPINEHDLNQHSQSEPHETNRQSREDASTIHLILVMETVICFMWSIGFAIGHNILLSILPIIIVLISIPMGVSYAHRIQYPSHQHETSSDTRQSLGFQRDSDNTILDHPNMLDSDIFPMMNILNQRVQDDSLLQHTEASPAFKAWLKGSLHDSKYDFLLFLISYDCVPTTGSDSYLMDAINHKIFAGRSDIYQIHPRMPNPFDSDSDDPFHPNLDDPLDLGNPLDSDDSDDPFSDSDSDDFPMTPPFPPFF